MTTFHRCLLGAGVVAVALWSAAAGAAAPASATASGKLINGEGKQIGTVKVTEAPKGVVLRIQANGLPPGWHGSHFHEVGRCTPSDFTSAGGHVWHTQPLVHGFLNPAANDAGDLPNVYVHADGSLNVEFYTNLVALNPGTDRPALLDNDGSAVLVHINPDDYYSQPIGGAGARIACAVLEKD